MIAAMVFIVKKITDMNVDMSQFRSPELIGVFGISTVIQTLQIICACIPWLVFTQSLSGKKIPFSLAMSVYTKSNIFKYVPGNVFQYIGRNQLAADMNISHVDVACATILDILFCVMWTGIISVILLGRKLIELLEKYGNNLLLVAVIGITILALGIILIRFRFREKVEGYISRYLKAIKKGNRFKLIQGVIYYFFHNILSAAMYFFCLRLIFGETLSIPELASLTGAFLFAWIIGFVTPGAPGGIGIRESVMLFVCGDKYEEKILLFVLAVRISSILSDIAAFIIGRIYFVVTLKKKKI